MQVEGYFSTHQINISSVIEQTALPVLKRDSSFVLFSLNQEGYVYFKNYGGIAFLNVNSDAQKQLLSQLSIELTEHQDELEIILDKTDEKPNVFGSINIAEIDLNTAHILCLNVAQSAALFYYQNLSDDILENTLSHTSTLESNGKLKMSKKNLLKYIGSTLNVKNKIAENLYIFDTPMFSWKDEATNKLDNELIEELEIEYRYKALKEQVNIIQENLETFLAIHQHNHSSILEWIIILLILFEILQVLVEKLLLKI